MEVKEFIATLEKMNFSLSVKDEKLNLIGDKRKLSEEEIEAIKFNNDVINYIKSHKEELIEYITVFSRVSSSKKAKDIISIYQLSALQQGMLFHGLYDGVGSYIEQFSCDIAGVNKETLMASWSEVIKRHSILRSAFYYDSFSVPVQCVYREVKLPLTELDYSGMDRASQQAALKDYEAADRARGFDFKLPPLMRLGLIRLDEGNYRMVWTSHHILIDGWSLPILMEEFLSIYELLISGHALPEVEEDRFEDYIHYLERRDKDAEERYWRNYLQGINNGTLLPFVRKTIERTKGIGKYESLSVLLDKTKTERILAYAQSNRLTVNTLMQSVWAWLLHRYTGDSAVLYGVVVSGRPDQLSGVERRVGMYINTIPFKAVFDENQEIISWLQGLQADQVSSRQYQHSALQDVQGWTGAKGDLFDSLLIFENYPVSQLIASGAWSLKIGNIEVAEQTNYPLTIVIESSDELRIVFSYNTDLLERAYVTGIRDQFEHVLLQITDGSIHMLSDIRLLTASQEQQLIVDFNNTEAPYPKSKSVIDLFEEQVIKSQGATAVVYEGTRLSYSELNEHSNRLAHYLQLQGVKADTLVPICIERGQDMIVGILGILKAGGAYVPIDPEYPQDRIHYMLEDTSASIVLSSRASSNKVRCSTSASVIELDGDWELIKKNKNSNPQSDIRPEHLAYVIYTSGSTGKPKGVMIEHGSLVASTSSRNLYYQSFKSELLIPSYSFDSSVAVIFGTLTAGGSLILSKDELIKDVDNIRCLLKQSDGILCVPSYYKFLLEEKLLASSHISRVILAGERLSSDLVHSHYNETGNVSLYNEYGPTENTVWATVAEIKSAEDPIPIGKPIPNTQVHILSPDGQLCPVGVTGEICLGGIGLSRGYLNSPDLTAEKFIKNPFNSQAGARLYNTGDLGRWLPDGNIEYLGRIDDQVKIRGFRIEPGEIEGVLNQSEQIRQAVVLANEDSNGNKQLVGYVVASGIFDKEAIQSYLGSKLPGYMVPGLWIEMESIPLTPNGKIDRKALPDPELTDITDKYVAPRNATEQALARIWQELLKVDRAGIFDNFFELGGHSLLAMRVASAIRRELGIELSVKDLFVNPTIAALTAHLDLQGVGSIVPSIEAIFPRPAYIPLSFSQERLWFIDRLEGSVQYHIPAVLRLRGKLDRAVLENTLRAIINRHEALRTVVLEHEGQGYQHILPANSWSLGTTEELAEGEEGLSQYIGELINKPFDLSRDYMLRADLIKVGLDDHMLVVTMHHMASDGWSVSILVKEVIALYEGYSGNVKTVLPALALQYADYAIWQRKYMQGEVLEKKLNYWEVKLDDVATLHLPTDYNRPAIQRSSGAACSLKIEQNLSAQLVELSRQQGATLYMTLLTAFKVLLYRYSGQEDICVGTPVAGRNYQELEKLIGFFVNTLALRSQVRGDMPFTELLQEVKNTTLEAYAHQEVPFEKIVDAVVKGRDMSRHPLFQVLISLQNTPDIPELKLGELRLTAENPEHTTSRFDIAFMLRETSSGIQGIVEYNTDLYSEERISRMTVHFAELLASVVSSPAAPVGQLELLSASEREQMLGFGRSKGTYPVEATVAGLFEAQALAHPDREAVIFVGTSISYQELNERANRLAHALRQLGVKEDTLVPLYTGRGIEMLTGILGILKAGAAYVPIDTEFPVDRVSYMLEDTGAAVAVSSGEYAGQLLSASGGYLEIVEADNLGMELSIANPARSLKPENLAYVIYTSGSTGKPKGVQVSHRNLVDYVYGLDERTKISACKSFALVSTIATDLGNTVLYSSLLFGGTLHVFSRETVSHIEALHEYFDEHRIDCLKIVPSHWKALSPEDGPPLLPARMLIFGGEAFPVESAARIRRYSADCRVLNHYGPTETTIGKLIYELEEGYAGRVIPIGRPFSNTRVYILSKEQMLCPVGVPGQLHIAGTGLARGYLNRAELTAEKFVADPYGEAGEQMYQTGDQVQYGQDGNITFLGRVDDQVKIRGYRVEPGEVGRILEESELIEQAVVLAREDKQGNKQLVGYIVPKGEYDRAGILEYLKEQLPDYMIPAHLVELSSLPLTANGKIDRKALPDPENTLPEEGYIAPQTETEHVLAEIWQELLGLERAGIHDNFFELGGHSLLAMRVVSSIRRELKVELNIRDLFIYPSIASLGEYLDKQKKGSLLPAIVAADRPTYIPLSFSQERLWFIDRLEGSVHYHVPAVLRLRGELKHEVLENVLRAIIHRHEVLRTVIMEHEGRGYQHIMDWNSWSLGITEASVYEERTKGISAHISDLINKPFDLSADYMLRANLIKLAQDDHILVVTMHHIASDGWSASILVKEVIALYQGYAGNKEAHLPALAVQYADYAIWQRNYMQGEVLENKLGYWKAKLDGVALLRMPTDYNRPAIQRSRGATRNFKIDQGLSDQLVNLSHQQEATLYMTLLSAFNVLLYRYSGQEDICLGTSVAGRPHRELEWLIGFFVNTLALRSRVSGDMPFIELLREVKVMTLEAYSHQEVPFEKVVDAVVNVRDMSRNPLFQVHFVLQNTPEVPELKLEKLSLSAESQEHTTAKFDIAFMVNETSSGIQGTVEYATDLYKEETIELMISHYITLLESIVASPAEKAGRLGMISKVEKRQLLVEFNDTQVDYPRDKSVIDLFEDQVVRSPGATAIVFGQDKLTYKELNERSNQLAHYLQRQGIKPEMLIPICIERSLEMIIAILGVMKAGGAYVPIDPDYPADRINYMLEDTRAELVLSSSESREKLTDIVKIIELDRDAELISRESAVNIGVKVQSGMLAYVIYTSGSTGKPKGVMIEHGGVVNLSLSQSHALRLKPGMRTLQFASFGFDASCYEIFNTFLSGGCLVLCKKEDILSVERFSGLVDKNQVEVVVIPPSFQLTIDSETLRIIKTIVSAGEPLNEATGKYLQSEGIRLINAYGPTETTVCASLSDDPIKPGNIITIGKPISNTQIYILSADGQLSPIGVTGEICVGGSGLARGYLNRPELTSEKFIPDPFSKEAGGRLYMTGDLGRWLTDGNIEYLGRIDDQVKIRGYRIELGEIESVLNESELVSHGVVLAKNDSNGNKRLVGYVVATGMFDKQAIQDYLSSKLPEYMVPALWVELRHLPLTPNGKIDRKSLPDPELTDRTDEYVAPRNTTEQVLAEIWQELLEVERAGIYDNFFELGGHSLLAIRVVSFIRKELNIELDIGDLFVYSTIAELAAFLNSNNKKGFRSLIPIKASGNKPPLYIICGAGGTVFKFREFASMLDNDQPVYGLQQFTDETDIKDFPDTIEGIAKKYIDEIQTENPDGPYALAGHCAGGTIAFEMANQLEAMGKKVSLLAMFDANATEQTEVIRGSLSNFYHIPALLSQIPAIILTIPTKIKFELFLLTKHPKQALLYKMRKVSPLFVNPEPTPEYIAQDVFDKLTKKLIKALDSYKLKPYKGDILLFNALQQYFFVDKENKIIYKELTVNYAGKYAWKKYARSVKSYKVKGEHSTMFEQVNAKEFSRIVQKHLDEGLLRGKES